MRLWSIQHLNAYRVLCEQGVLRANEQYLFPQGEFPLTHAYSWMIEEMKQRIGPPPHGVRFPIWAWVQWEGKRKARSIRQQGHASPGTPMVQLTIDLPDDQVVLSDFDLFHFCLMFCFLPSDEQQDRMFEEACSRAGVRESDLQLNDLQSPALSRLRQQAEHSWQKIFDLSFWNASLYGDPRRRTIQATFWELRIEQVRKVQKFIAR